MNSKQQGLDVAKNIASTLGASDYKEPQSVICLQGNGIDRADTAGCNGKGWKEDVSYTLNTMDRPAVFENHSQSSRYKDLGDICQTVSANYGEGGNNQPLVVGALCAADGTKGVGQQYVNQNKFVYGDHTKEKDTYTEKRFGEYFKDDKSITLRNAGASYGGKSEVLVQEKSNVEAAGAVCIGNGQVHEAMSMTKEVSRSLNCMHEQMAVMIPNNVRRLTPLECERLQGFPDGWTLIGEPEEVEVKDYKILYDEDGNEKEKHQTGTHKEIEYFYIDRNGKKKKCTDSARYKVLGNSIALPFWFYLLRRIAAQYERPATLGSLFDGIGGFPLCWERCNGTGTAIWASEIEDFPIEVTRRRFGE